MPFAKKMKVMEKCLSQSDSKQRDEKKMLIFDIGFFCVLSFKRLKVGLFDVVENGSGASATDEKQVLYFPSIRIQQKGEKTN